MFESISEGELIGTVVVIVVILAFAAPIIKWIYTKIDSYKQPDLSGMAMIVEKLVIPLTSEYQPDYDAFSEMVVDVLVNAPERYRFEVEIDGMRASAKVPHNIFDRFDKGQRVKIRYRIGRFSKKIVYISMDWVWAYSADRDSTPETA